MNMEEEIQRQMDRQIVRGYTRIPQEQDAWVEAVARESIGAEPW